VEGSGKEQGKARRTASLTLRLALSVALVLLAGGTAVALAAFAYGRQAAQQAYDRLLIGAADQIAGSVSVRDGAVSVDIPASASSCCRSRRTTASSTRSSTRRDGSSPATRASRSPRRGSRAARSPASRCG
jgi:hypothetical protein